MADQREINGIDVQELGKAIHGFVQAPELARFRFRAVNAWDSGGHNTSTIEGFYGASQEMTSPTRPFRLEADEPAILLGQDRGPNPVEYLLSALAACMTSSMVYHAAARGLRLESVESRLEGEIDLQGFLGLSDRVRKGYQRIQVTFRVKGDGTPEQLEELCRFSPVLDVVSHGTDVRLAVEKAEDIPTATRSTPEESARAPLDPQT